MCACRVVVRGRVQGVAFRAATEREARSLGLVGFVRNRRDGSVELIAQGEGSAVEALVRWCGSGPSLARVDAVETEEVEVDASLTDFAIAATV